jgi:tetratricopeptide (TPR) repeat protein
MRLRNLFRLACLAAAGWCAASAAPAAEPPEPVPQPVREPHYGDALFHFFQDNHFTAITTLMASQHFGRVVVHADEAELLRGGMLLSYGLHREAGHIFAGLIDKGVAPSVRRRAWFFVAKIRYQRGFYDQAQEALAHIDGVLPGELEEERGLLQANLLMAQGNHAGAAYVLGTMAQQGKAAWYARFNLGVALIASGEAERGMAMLDELGRSPTPAAMPPRMAVEEFRGLRDRANVALGYAALQQHRPQAARGALSRVRLAAMDSNKALLGYGWAAAELHQPKEALVPWTELLDRDVADAAVLEARIAVPYAYAELGAYGQSLARYQETIDVFERESARLDESIAAIRAGTLVHSLLERNPGTDMPSGALRVVPEDMPHAGHLTPVLAQHEFQEAFKNLRDLHFLSRNLQHWREQLGVFGDMLDNRRKAYAERLPRVLAGAHDSTRGVAALPQRREGLARELAEAVAAEDGQAFADARERALMTRLANMEAALRRLGHGPEHEEARERARLAAGTLRWQLAQEYPERAWTAKKAMEGLDQQLAEAQRREAALVQAQRDEPARFDAFGQRITHLGERIEVLMPRVTALTGEQQRAVEDIAVAELTRQKERLAAYAVQARYAVAQLYDRASLARNPTDATQP